MSKWLLRGLVFAALMVFVRLLQGVLINALDTWALTISITLVVLFAIGAFAWGIIDGRGDARDQPGPRSSRRPRHDVAPGRAVRGIRQRPGVRGSSRCSTTTSTPSRCSTSSPRSRRSPRCWSSSPPSRVSRSAGTWWTARPRPSSGTAPTASARTPTCSRPFTMTTTPGDGCRPTVQLAETVPVNLEPESPSSPSGGQVTQRQQVSLHAEPDDHAGRDGAQVRVVPELLACMHVRDVHLDQWRAQLRSMRHAGRSTCGSTPRR